MIQRELQHDVFFFFESGPVKFEFNSETAIDSTTSNSFISDKEARIAKMYSHKRNPHHRRLRLPPAAQASSP